MFGGVVVRVLSCIFLGFVALAVALFLINEPARATEQSGELVQLGIPLRLSKEMAAHADYKARGLAYLGYDVSNLTDEEINELFYKILEEMP